jgi:hypothetical protein
LEEYTGKDTTYGDMAKLVKEKKVLENRVKHLEKTSMNWAAAQFQATKASFYPSNSAEAVPRLESQQNNSAYPA